MREEDVEAERRTDGWRSTADRETVTDGVEGSEAGKVES